MKKQASMVIGLVVAVVLLLAAVAGWGLRMGTPYPGIQKPAASVAEVEDTFRDSKEIVLPPEDAMGETPFTCMYDLDGRTSHAKPVGYTLEKAAEHNGTRISVVISCKKAANAPDKTDLEYQGIPIRSVVSQSKENPTDGSVTYGFSVGEYGYELSGYYHAEEQTQAETQAELQDQLLSVTQSMIDRSCAKNQG